MFNSEKINMQKPVIFLAAVILMASCGKNKNNGDFELKGS
jgi:hypothetical protein